MNFAFAKERFEELHKQAVEWMFKVGYEIPTSASTTEEFVQVAAQFAATQPKWVCFHCEFATSDPAEAEAHFGDRDDGEEFKPICKWWARMDDTERKEQFQQLHRHINDLQRDNDRLRTSNEALEYRTHAEEMTIKQYKPFKDCRTINDVFNLFDSMEGRALAAEERRAELEKRVQSICEEL